MSVDFSSALNTAAVVATRIVRETSLDVRLVRDQQGRISFLFNCEGAELSFDLREQIRDVQERLGVYAADPCVKTRSNVPHPEIYFTEGWHEVWMTEDGSSPFLMPVRDETAWGRDWQWLSRDAKAQRSKRVVFHGLKGGVGRSTALAVFARFQAKAGRRVLVLDLDIESPGASNALLAPDLAPSFGVIDWLAEDLVGSDALNVDDCYVESALSSEERGTIFVVPATGSRDEDFVPKLGRAYIESDGRRFADRVERMLQALEEKLVPDLVLIDCRAGIHEISAFAITRLSDLSLLFFADTEQNWNGYRQLFEFWKSRPEVLKHVREKLLAVRALASESSDFQAFLERSHSLFLEGLYDDTPPGGGIGLFSFDLKDESAPHFPPIIHLHPRFHERNLLRAPEYGGISSEELRLAFGQFIARVTEALGLD